MLTLVSLLLVGGSLGDQLGRKRMFVFGLIGFGATSILCALAPTVEFLVGARALQGIAGALLVPGSLAIVAATFEGAARGKAVGTWTAWTGIATVLGPPVGGVGPGALLAGGLLGQHPADRGHRGADPRTRCEESATPTPFAASTGPGIGLSAAGLAGPVFALIEQPTRGWGDPIVWVPMIAGVACFALFVVHEARARHPMLDLALFRIRNFWVANLTTLSAYAGLIGGLFFVGLFLQQVGGYSPVEAGLATTPISLILFFLSPRWGRLASGTGPRLPMSRGADRRRPGPDHAAPGQRRRRIPDRGAAGDPGLRPRPLGDRGAADRDRARLGRGTPRRHRLGRQQRRLARGRAAGDRRARRGDLGQVRRERRQRSRQPAR